jgi:hypothetical protein
MEWPGEKKVRRFIVAGCGFVSVASSCAPTGAVCKISRAVVDRTLPSSTGSCWIRFSHSSIGNFGNGRLLVRIGLSRWE